jgi:putative glutamine amidotransferase
MKPIIGINVDIVDTEPDKCSLQLTYMRAIIAAGGVPLLLPPVPAEDIPRVVAMIDGLLLTGGDDYDPSFYGQVVSEHTKIGVKQRQEFDQKLAQYVLKQTKLPVLGICAGCQLTNIVLGGTLVQDIPSHVPGSHVQHSNNNGLFGMHDVFLNPESKLSPIYNGQVIVAPTWHHQAVKQPGVGLNIVAHAADGIIEAVELSGDRFVLGVQWHPEQQLDVHLCLFQEFVASAQSHQANVNVWTLVPETVTRY